ncbi:MAG: HAD family hydrolase [Rhodoluna sp.]
MGSEPKHLKLSRAMRARAAQISLTITDPDQFKLASKLDVVVLNKTGTLTSPEMQVVKVRLAYGSDMMHEKEVLAIAAAIEIHSKHPIAKAIVAEARRKRLKKPDAVDFRVIPGHGVVGYLEGDSILVGGPILLTSRNVPIYVDDLVRSDAANQVGHTVVYVVRNSVLLGMIELQEHAAKGAAELVNYLHALKIRVAMVTGDATGVADYVAKQFGIAEVFAEVLPGKRFEVIQKLKSDGSKVGLVGHLEIDGLSLAEAQVGIAIGSDGSQPNSPAGLHLAKESIEGIYDTVMLSRDFRKKRLRTRLILLALAAVGISVGAFEYVSIYLATR